MLEKFRFNDLEIIDKGEQQNQIKICIRGLKKFLAILNRILQNFVIIHLN